jgi:hypothetical protein
VVLPNAPKPDDDEGAPNPDVEEVPNPDDEEIPNPEEEEAPKPKEEGAPNDEVAPNPDEDEAPKVDDGCLLDEASKAGFSASLTDEAATDADEKEEGAPKPDEV